MLANQNHEGSLQKTHWRSITSSRKVWWLDNGWPQCPSWGRWISKQLCISKLRSNEVYSTESWRSEIERFGGTHYQIFQDAPGTKFEFHERNPCAPQFEERVPEEASRQEDCARKVTTRSDKPACGKPMRTDPDKPATGNRESAHTKDEMDKEDPTPGILEWLQPFTDNLEDLETHVPAHSSRELRFGRCYKSGDKSDAQYLYSLPKDRNCDVCLRTKIPKVPCIKRKEGSIPRAEKFGDLNSGSQSPQRRKWIPEQSPIRSHGTRSCHSMDPILSVQNKNSSGDGKGFTKVSRTVQKLFTLTVH